MKQIKVAFYRNSNSFFGRLIRFQQYRIQGLPYRSARYSHVELVFSDGFFFSSSEQDGGVRGKKINDDKNHWDYILVDVTADQEAAIREFCEKNTHNRYNWFGIFFAQILKTMWFLRPHDFFCSEFCVKALQRAKMLCGVDGVMINPAQLHVLLSRNTTRPQSR